MTTTRVNTHRALRRALRQKTPAGATGLAWDLVGSLGEYNQHVARLGSRAGKIEAELVAAHPSGSFTVEGHCWVDARPVAFGMDYLYAPGDGSPNWRERMVCPVCGLNNRQRSALHLATEVLGLRADSRVYITEQVTTTYNTLKSRIPGLIGSEFLGADTAPGHVDERGIRHEDLTRLSMANDSLDAILCFDVLEHVPGYDKALAECLRVLAPGGALLFSVPFLQDRDATRVRARFDAAGALVHDHPPVYHGDPVQPERGVLCFQEFGWDILERLRSIGFSHATAIACHDERYGYLGGITLLLVAWKPLGLAATIADWATATDSPARIAYRKLLPLSVRRALRGGVRAVAAPRIRSYDRQLEEELARFEKTVDVHDLPKIFHYWAHRWVRPKMESMGFSNPDAFFARFLEKAYHQSTGGTRRYVSVGAGNCDTEIRAAMALRERGLEDFVIECLEINPAMVKRGAADAQRQGVGAQVRPIVADFNRWGPDGRYDAVMANQSLHHVTNLEGLFDAVGKAIDGRGLFAVSDIIGRNGHQRWPEALAIVREFWNELPPRYRFNLQLRRQEDTYLDWDCSIEGFEGVRAQDILPLMIQRFSFDLFAPYANVIDPFVDRSFGHHFDPDTAWDLGFIERVHERDEQEIRRGAIKPTHMIAVLGAGREGEGRCLDGLTPKSCVR